LFTTTVAWAVRANDSNNESARDVSFSEVPFDTQTSPESDLAMDPSVEIAIDGARARKSRSRGAKLLPRPLIAAVPRLAELNNLLGSYS
jgi:hypothetical protein